MFTDANQVKSKDGLLQTQLCIIGGGAAGIEIARFFNKSATDVILVESGSFEFDAQTQKLYAMNCIGKPIRDGGYDFNTHLAEPFKGECRVRMFGGTTNIWSGKWKQLEPIDFEDREHIPDSGWPLTYDKLSPFYQEISRDYGIPNFEHLLNLEHKHSLSNHSIAKAGDLKFTLHYTQDPALNFGETFRDELQRSRNVNVLLNSNACELWLNDDLSRVKSLLVKTLKGQEFSIYADNFVLACGGIENARLLLASNRQITSGIGNSQDLVGRFYMDHPKAVLGKIKPLSRKSLPNIFFADQDSKKAHRIGISLSDKIQRSDKTLNHNFYLKPIYFKENQEGYQILSSMVKAILSFEASALIELVKKASKRTKVILKVLVGILLKTPARKISAYQIVHYLEQSPNRNSRVLLSQDTDVLGMQKPVIDWEFSAVDQHSFEAFVEKIKMIFSECKIGEVLINPTSYETLDFLQDASHHMGTTRMGTTPQQGVVDLNCQVFGVENLFVAGSSVFPTGGNANPTYTILALARRLAIFLHKKISTLSTQDSNVTSVDKQPVK